jgi:hypothetical protein
MIKKLNKKGISVMIGYVLLVSAAIIMGAITYNWMKIYVPTNEDLKCPDGISIAISEISCAGEFCTGYSENNCEEYTDKLSCIAPCTWKNLTDNLYRVALKAKNNGRFETGGFFIRGTTLENSEIAILNLALDDSATTNIEGVTEDGDGKVFGEAVLFGENDGKNHYNPGTEAESFFIINKEIFSVEIMPWRFQEQDNKLRFATCGNAIIREKIQC